MNFKQTTNSASGTCLQGLVTVSSFEIRKAFGNPRDGYYAPEDGYDGTEYLFESETGDVVSLYTRWGCWRIGASCSEVAVKFAAWCVQQLPGFSSNLISSEQALALLRAHHAVA